MNKQVTVYELKELLKTATKSISIHDPRGFVVVVKKVEDVRGFTGGTYDQYVYCIDKGGAHTRLTISGNAYVELLDVDADADEERAMLVRELFAAQRTLERNVSKRADVEKAIKHAEKDIARLQRKLQKMDK